MMLAVALSLAHQLFLMPSSFHVSNGERITVALHNGDSFPDSEGPPALERLRDFTLHAAKLQYNVTNIRLEGKRAVGDARIPAKGTLVISARTVPNFIELPAEAFEKYLKEEGMERVIAWRGERGESAKPGREMYSKYVKSLIRAESGDETFAKPLGLAIELVPDKDPYTLRTGERMPVRLLWKGKPVAGAMVESARATAGEAAHSQAVGRTDADGRVQVFLNGPGKWRLNAIAIERCADAAKADWESYWASLTFEIR